MAPDSQGRIRFRSEHRMVSRWLHRVREPFAWGIAPTELSGFLATLGWQLTALAGASDLRRDILAPAGLADEPLAEGEHLATAVSPP
jgi:hypothetical protein